MKNVGADADTDGESRSKSGAQSWRSAMNLERI
jgi:hypothetical protein